MGVTRRDLGAVLFTATGDRRPLGRELDERVHERDLDVDDLFDRGDRDVGALFDGDVRDHGALERGDHLVPWVARRPLKGVLLLELWEAFLLYSLRSLEVPGLLSGRRELGGASFSTLFSQRFSLLRSFLTVYFLYFL